MLVIDDRRSNIAMLARVLKMEGCQRVVGVGDPERAVEAFLSERPDIVLLDIAMPGRDGFQVLDDLKPLIPPDDLVPIVMLTADRSHGSKQRALSMGAHDFITKPFDINEVLLRMSNLLHLRFLHLELRKQNATLEEQVRQRINDLNEARYETLDRLALAAEFRDDITGRHTRRVGALAREISLVLQLPEEEAERIGRAAPLHDIGKLAVPDALLLKPGALTPEEFEKVKTHSEAGARILSGSSSATLREAETIALTHHERWDGTGYPQGIAGEAIPLSGRIVAVVDVFDALTHKRPYKQAWSRPAALREIQGQAGAQFDPQVVKAFLKVQRRRSLPRRTGAASGLEPIELGKEAEALDVRGLGPL